MSVLDLNSKWENVLHFKNKKGYNALRISAECVPDLFIATNLDGYRCLLLFLQANIEVKIKGSDKEKLSLAYLKNKNVIVIKLNDVDFIDLFNDLILSLYEKIKNINDAKKSSKELIYSFYKWADFFEDKLNTKLSIEEIKGLFGELFVLNELLEDSNSIRVNSILESWKGPYDTTNDFVFDTKNIEVKTKEESKYYVKISSEYQLEKEFDKGLELLIVSVNIDLINGESIHDLLNKIVKYLRINSGDASILYKALNQKGLTLESVKQYNNHKFIVVKSDLYDCNLDDFPKLSVSNIPEEITGLRYKLRVNTLSPFLIEGKKY